MKKLTIGEIQKVLWNECKRIIRAKYVSTSPPERWECYTCGKVITEKKDAHTAHFIPKSICGAFLKYDLRNLRVCCYRCNVWLTGNGTAYYKNMVEREGQEYVDQLFRDKQKIIKAYDHYEYLLNLYSNTK
jgi:hypothetical protein